MLISSRHQSCGLVITFSLSLNLDIMIDTRWEPSEVPQRDKENQRKLRTGRDSLLPREAGLRMVQSTSPHGQTETKLWEKGEWGMLTINKKWYQLLESLEGSSSYLRKEGSRVWYTFVGAGEEREWTALCAQTRRVCFSLCSQGRIRKKDESRCSLNTYEMLSRQ